VISKIGKIVAIDVAKMKVYKSIDYLEHRNLSGINKAGETKANTTMLNRMFFVFIIIFLLLKLLPNCTRNIFINRQNLNNKSYVDPGSSKYQVGKIIAIDVAKMKVYKSIDYPERGILVFG
jgi:phage-related protein